MRAETTSIDGVLVVSFDVHEDERGWFAETYDAETYQSLGLPTRWIQDSSSYSSRVGTIRGLHFQAAPSEQAKLVRVVAGAIFDVAVDLRRDSATFGRSVAVELDRTQGFYVPTGFAHGYCTLTEGTEIAYKMSSAYNADRMRGVAWNDPDLNIQWPDLADESTLSERDRGLPHLRDIDPFS